jgi:hypothetical protein
VRDARCTYIGKGTSLRRYPKGWGGSIGGVLELVFRKSFSVGRPFDYYQNVPVLGYRYSEEAGQAQTDVYTCTPVISVEL